MTTALRPTSDTVVGEFVGAALVGDDGKRRIGNPVAENAGTACVAERNREARFIAFAFDPIVDYFGGAIADQENAVPCANNAIGDNPSADRAKLPCTLSRARRIPSDGVALASRASERTRFLCTTALAPLAAMPP